MYGQQDRILAIVNGWSTKIKYGLEQCCRQGSKDACQALTVIYSSPVSTRTV